MKPFGSKGATGGRESLSHLSFLLCGAAPEISNGDPSSERSAHLQPDSSRQWVQHVSGQDHVPSFDGLFGDLSRGDDRGLGQTGTESLAETENVRDDAISLEGPHFWWPGKKAKRLGGKLSVRSKSPKVQWARIG